MEEFPSNAHSTAKKVRTTRTEVTTEKTIEEKPKVEPIVTGEVIRRKKPLGRRFLETFVGGDARGVMGYVVMDVLLPAARDMIFEGFTQGLEKTLYPDGRSGPGAGRRIMGSRPSGQAGYVRYASSATRPGWQEPARAKPEAPQPRRRSDQVDQVLMQTRAECDQVLARMQDMIERYETVTVADYYNLVGEPATTTDDKWGWLDLRKAGVQRLGHEKYTIVLPPPEPVE